MAFTQADLTALEGAIKTGVLEVRRGDRMVKYRDLAEMLQARDLIRAELGLVEKSGVGVQFLGHSKGIK